jgi:Sulfotransferase family
MWGGEVDYFRRLYARRSAFGEPSDARNRARIITAYLAIEPFRRLRMDAEFLRERLMKEGVTWRDLFASMLRACADSKGKLYAGEKTPGHALHVNTLCEWFPDCSIVHLARDPRASVGSLIQMPWATRSVLMGARTWRLFNAGACAASTRDNYLLVKYEALVNKAEEQVRRI